MRILDLILVGWHTGENGFYARPLPPGEGASNSVPKKLKRLLLFRRFSLRSKRATMFQKPNAFIQDADTNSLSPGERAGVRASLYLFSLTIIALIVFSSHAFAD